MKPKPRAGAQKNPQNNRAIYRGGVSKKMSHPKRRNKAELSVVDMLVQASKGLRNVAGEFVTTLFTYFKIPAKLSIFALVRYLTIWQYTDGSN